jgi:hypothetical protein
MFLGDDGKPHSRVVDDTGDLRLSRLVPLRFGPSPFTFAKARGFWNSIPTAIGLCSMRTKV